MVTRLVVNVNREEVSAGLLPPEYPARGGGPGGYGTHRKPAPRRQLSPSAATCVLPLPSLLPRLTVTQGRRGRSRVTSARPWPRGGNRADRGLSPRGGRRGWHVPRSPGPPPQHRRRYARSRLPRTSVS